MAGSHVLLALEALRMDRFAHSQPHVALSRARCHQSPIGSSYGCSCRYNIYIFQVKTRHPMANQCRKAQTNTINIYTSVPPLDIPLGRYFNIHGCRETSVNGMRSSGLYLSNCKAIRVCRSLSHGVYIPVLSGLLPRERRAMEF